ncbi:MAG: hypothetical protein ACKO96_07465, partial [Flammeovirgaceae bacterium]
MTVLISIVLGLGITQILTGIADLIHQSDRVKIYWPHLIWVLLVLVMHVQDWWVTYELKTYQPWRLPIFLFAMLYPINLFVLARLLFPFGWQEGSIDLRVFYEENFRRIFGFASGLIFLAILDEFLIRKFDSFNVAIKSFLLVSLVILVSKKSLPNWAHYTIA